MTSKRSVDSQLFALVNIVFTGYEPRVQGVRLYSQSVPTYVFHAPMVNFYVKHRIAYAYCGVMVLSY